MAACSYCGSTILFGGIREGELRFCNEKCHEAGGVLVLAQNLPYDVIQQEAYQVFHGLCPRCQGSGPVDVYWSYRIWSALLFTSWTNTPNVCCSSCGRTQAIKDGLFSLFLGWWGIPWGVIMTPVQLVRNLRTVVSPAQPTSPSADLEHMVRVMIAQQIAEEPLHTQSPTG